VVTYLNNTVNQTDTASADAGFFSELSQAIHRVDLLILAVVPLVMIGVFLLPEETRRAFAFQYTKPTFLTAFTAHYVHLTVEHLLGNLVGYCLLATSGYTLSVLAGKRRFFLTTLVTFLCVFPFVLSALNLAVPRHAIGYGFSGVNMAFVGLLPLALASYGRVQFFPASTVQFLPAVFLITTGWITMLALPLGTTGIGLASTAIALGSLIAGVLYFVLVLPVRRWQFRSWIRTILARGYYSDLFVLGLALFIAYPIIGFPSNPVAGGSVLNLYVHLLGFCLGFIGPYTLLSIGLFSQ